MTVEKFDFDSAISVTPAAARHFRTQLKDKNGKYLRISIARNGCSGYKYVFEEVGEGQETDLTLDLEDGLKVFVAPDAISVLHGAQIDYVFEGVNQVLTINNPNVTASCGCGESFSIE
ncbi:MAG: iron-sulfur cluster assembly accessory protein [Porticoccaceae bacterium]|nr:iron-sulfur cluster assembly accessory protein [Porticoccaceae bacterium]